MVGYAVELSIFKSDGVAVGEMFEGLDVGVADGGVEDESGLIVVIAVMEAGAIDVGVLVIVELLA